jgi:5'-nucleotidase
MPSSLQDKLVVAISSRALFALDEANRIFESQGLEAYRAHQISRETEPLAPGTGFPLVKALLSINERGHGDLVEVVLVSRNDADTGLRVMNSAEHHGLAIHRACFTDGQPTHPYLRAFCSDLFLSAHEQDVARAIDDGFAAALVYQPPDAPVTDETTVRIAFDGDAVLFSGEYERVYREQGLAEFHRQEKESAAAPMAAGPFKGFLAALHKIQRLFDEPDCPLRTALVTARSIPAHKRAINTLRAWNIRVDEAFFLGGLVKDEILRIYRPHIFFDDQTTHCEPAAKSTPTARVPSGAIRP